ncbi:protein arginine N-methyltransferase 9-like [Choristoneura fumiferana]|uniref:protein arginine N-methyltransferase 9-like n=1 Tax=Choristoneura fumiferana TaxID=7141 RepID=UPI003D1536BF
MNYSSITTEKGVKKMEDLCKAYITYARQLSSQGLYNKAFDFYLMAFGQCPETKSIIESEFRVVLIRLNELLANYGKIEQIFINFDKAVNAFPGNMYLLNDIGKYLFKYGYYSVAWCHFQKALNVDSGFVDAEKNLNSVKNLLVERWHFRMLNDRFRNEAYHAAIVETVIPGKDSVLDMGTGTGLLAMYANECTPLATTGCEGSDIMAKLAETIMQENLVQDVVIVNKMSTNMDCKEIGGRRSLLVTEMFDSGLLGEQVLQSLSHAWNNLIAHSGRVIPCSAEFFVVAAKCDRLNMKYQLQHSAKELLNIPGLTVHTLTFGETYDCEDVHLFKDIKYMTDTQSLLKINYNSYDDIKGKLQGNEPLDIKWTVKEGGEINIVVGWFNLHLTENIMITTNPTSDSRANAWQQAVFFNFIPRNAHENETLEAQFLINGGKMTLVPDDSIHISWISPETIRFLNDYEYTKKITDCIGTACVYLGQIVEISQADIVDTCPFPLFGLLMMKHGARSLVCCAKSSSDKKFFKKVFKANKVPLSKITFFIGNQWTSNSLGKTKYHAIFCHTFELCGDIDLRQQEIAQHLKQRHLHQEGLYLPANVHLIGQLVSSHWLDINNRVYDENVTNYKIAMHINKFQVSQNYCIDFTNLDYFEISSPTVIGTLTSEMESDVINIPVIHDGNANAILCWYCIELLEDLGGIQTNRSDSFIDGMAFLAHPALPMVQGGFANVLRCVDFDGSFKLMVDTDAM